MKIKICGITKEREIDYLNQVKTDYAGFVIFEKSKRYVTVEQAKQLFEKLDRDIKKVAVTVSPSAKMFPLASRITFASAASASAAGLHS